MESEEGLAGSLDITWAPPFRGRALGGLWRLRRPRPPAVHHHDHVTLVCARAQAVSIRLLCFQFRKIWKLGLAFPWISRGDHQPHTRVQPEASTGCGEASLLPGEPGPGAGNPGPLTHL